VASFSGPFSFYRGIEQNNHPFDEKYHCRTVIFLIIINNYALAKKMPAIEIAGLCLPLKPQKEKFPLRTTSLLNEMEIEIVSGGQSLMVRGFKHKNVY
jgi:hypothetical protein